MILDTVVLASVCKTPNKAAAVHKVLSILSMPVTDERIVLARIDALAGIGYIYTKDWVLTVAGRKALKENVATMHSAWIFCKGPLP